MTQKEVVSIIPSGSSIGRLLQFLVHGNINIAITGEESLHKAKLLSEIDGFRQESADYFFPTQVAVGSNLGEVTSPVDSAIVYNPNSTTIFSHHAADVGALIQTVRNSLLGVFGTDLEKVEEEVAEAIDVIVRVYEEDGFVCFDVDQLLEKETSITLARWWKGEEVFISPPAQFLCRQVYKALSQGELLSFNDFLNSHWRD